METTNELAMNLSSRALGGFEEIRAQDKSNMHLLISCTKKKLDHPAPAKLIYTSTTFRESVRTAELLGIKFSILSAKFGILDPDRIIDPYDVSIKGMDAASKAKWALEVVNQLSHIINDGTNVMFFAGEDYCKPLVHAAEHRSWSFSMPMRGLPLGYRVGFLRQLQRLDHRSEAIERLYELFSALVKETGFNTLEDVVQTQLPKQGLYFFFDEHEPSKYSTRLPRLVRVGTHAVSAGSKATLRTRLRAHLGLAAGGGNHRASIFRLHVGRALIERSGMHERFPDWGKGQSAERSISETEAELEKEVSAYIKKLRLLYLPIADEAGKRSDRAILEAFVIALITEYLAILDLPSKSWLGNWSDRNPIRNSGLWNVRGVGVPADLSLMDKLEQFGKLFETY